MKLINRKTRKAIDKSVRKALKKHGPALVAGLASGLASSLATLAKTEAPGQDGTGKSNLATMAEKLGEALTPDGLETKHHHGKKKHRHHHKEHREPEMTQQTQPAMT